MAKSKLKKFWKELKRRKVVRVIIIYATTAFILLQIVDVLVKPLHFPAWVMSFFTVALILGFPIAIRQGLKPADRLFRIFGSIGTRQVECFVVFCQAGKG